MQHSAQFGVALIRAPEIQIMSTQDNELEILKKEIKDVKIVLANPTSNTNYVKITLGKTPLHSMLILNKLFFLWQKHRTLEDTLGH